MLIHGGFWRAQYGRKLMRPLAEDLVGRGWAAWNVEYRRLGRGSGGGWPTTLDDVAAAVDHLAELAGAPRRPPTVGVDSEVAGGPRDVRPAPPGRRAPLDLSRVVAIGHSAGGHLAAWAASRGRLEAGAPGARPRVPLTGAVAQAGVLDLALAWELGLSAGVVGAFMGGSPAERPERYAVASPAALAPAGVPVLLTHGARDDVVPLAVSEAYAAVAGCALHVEPAEDHFGHLDVRNPLWQAVVEWLA